MEAGLSAIPFYLASASSPVAATTMDREPVGRAGEGEAVAASGAAAAAAFKESAPQVGGGCGRESPASSPPRPPAALLACQAFLRAAAFRGS